MKTSLMKTIGGACVCVCAMLCTGVAEGATTVKTLSLRRDLPDNRITLGTPTGTTTVTTTLAKNFDGDLASSTLEPYIKADTTTTPTTAYQWYCYPGSYSLSADLTISLWAFGIYLDTAETTYDCRDQTLNLGGAGISFVSSTAAKQDVYLTYKGGTWNFSSVTGSGGKLVGNGAESMIVKPTATATDRTTWSTSGNYTKQHGVVDGATIYKPNCSFYLFGGNINSTLEFKNSAQFTTEKDLFLSHYTTDSIAFGAGGNTLTIGGGSKVTCPQFYTDTSGASTIPLSVNGTAIVKDTGSSLEVVNTLFLGAVVGGNTIQVKDGAYVKASTGGSGSGICLGVNNANSCSNTLEIADGGHVTIGSDTTKLSLSIGHSNGSIGNKVIVRKGGSLTASYVKLDQSGSLTSGYNGDDNSFIAEAGSTVSLSANVPFNLYGNNSKISLATGNAYASDSIWSYGTVFDMTAKVSKETDSTTGNTTYTLQGCTNNTLEILSGTTFNVTRELKLGEQSSLVTYPYVPSIGSTIVVGNEATLKVDSQVFCSGPRNTLVLSNGTLNCTYQSAYAFYWGDMRCVTLSQGSAGNKIVLYGNKPQLKTQTAQCSSGYPCISFGGSMEIDVNLPETLAYEKIPFVCGRFVLERWCRFKLPNIDKIYAAMAKSAQTSVSFTLAEAAYFSGYCTTENASELPSTCKLSVVDVKDATTGEATGTKQLILTVTHSFSGGSGTSADPYLLGTVDDMKELQTLLANGTDYKGKYFKQTADVTLSSWTGIGQNNEGNITNAYGQTIAFNGTFDGDGKTLTMSFDSDTKYTGLFNITTNATIKNLTINLTGSGKGFAGVAGLLCDSTVENVTITGSATGTHNVGGIAVKAAGSTTTIRGCTNNADITTSYTKLGGLVSFAQEGSSLTLVNCANNGEITSTKTNASGDRGVGGLVGWVKIGLTLENCSNTGAVTWENETAVGSLVGAFGQNPKQYASCNGDLTATGCMAPSAMAPIGQVFQYAGTVTGLNWATVAGGVATFCDTPSAAGTYTAMMKNADPISFGTANGDVLTINERVEGLYTGTVSSAVEGYTAYQSGNVYTISGDGTSYEKAFTSIAAYNAAVTAEATAATYANKDTYVVLSNIEFRANTDYSFAMTLVNPKPDPLTQPKLHAFFYNCKFPENSFGLMSGNGPGQEMKGSDRKMIAIDSVKELVVQGCTFPAFTYDSYVIDLNLYNWYENDGCGITIKDNVFAAGAGNRVPLSVKNKIANPPAFVLITGNTFHGANDVAGTICFGDGPNSTTTYYGANFPITIEDNTFDEGTTYYRVMSGVYNVQGASSGKDTYNIPVDKSFTWSKVGDAWAGNYAFKRNIADGVTADLTSDGTCTINATSEGATLTAAMVSTLGKSAVKNVTLGANITTVDASAFAKCFNLKSVTSTASSLTLADYAFYRCNSITEMNFAAMPTLGENSITMQAAIYMKDGLPSVYPIPQITVSGYHTELVGTNELKGNDTVWTAVDPTDATARGSYHFFKLRIVANSQD